MQSHFPSKKNTREEETKGRGLTSKGMPYTSHLFFISEVCLLTDITLSNFFISLFKSFKHKHDYDAKDCAINLTLKCLLYGIFFYCCRYQTFLIIQNLFSRVKSELHMLVSSHQQKLFVVSHTHIPSNPLPCLLDEVPGQTSLFSVLLINYY